MTPDPPDNGGLQMPQDNTLTLAADLVFGGLWPGAPMLLTEPGHPARDLLAITPDTAEGGWWLSCSGFGPVRTSTIPAEWLSLRLPGHRGSALHVLTEAIKERVGVDSQGKVRAPASGATWRTAAEVADASNSGDAPSIMQASAILVMTDALAAELGWPTGKGAPVWSWTEANLPDRHGGKQWKLSARASSKESWSAWHSSDLTDPMAALEDVWRARGGDRACASEGA